MTHNSEKALLYQVLSILMDKRLATSGARTPVLVGLKEFSPALEYMPVEMNDSKKVSILGEIMRNLVKEKTKSGTLLFEIADQEKLDSFSKSYRANIKIAFIFSREELDAYIKYLMDGDKIRRGTKKGHWFDKKTGRMKEGRIPSATHTGEVVQKISVINPEIHGEPTHIVVNDDYENPLEIKPEQKFWKVVVTLANGELPPQMSHEDARYIRDYSLNKCNVLYSKGGFCPTRLFRIINDEPHPIIKIKKTTHRKLKITTD